MERKECSIEEVFHVPRGLHSLIRGTFAGFSAEIRIHYEVTTAVAVVRWAPSGIQSLHGRVPHLLFPVPFFSVSFLAI